MPTVTDDDGTGTTGTPITQAWLNTVFIDWTSVTFSAGNFTGNGSMTWTVASGDVLRNRFCIVNKILHWLVQIATSTVGGTPNTRLQIAAPGGVSFGSTGDTCRASYVSDNGTEQQGLVAPSSTTVMGITLPWKGGGNWAASTDNTYLYFAWMGEIS